jgi:hypothetical protein
MKSLSKWVCVMVATGLLAGTATAADTVSAGKVKSINADKKEFVLTDAANKDWTFKIADNVLINRNGKESAGELKPGDPVSICYDKGAVTWTAHYILVQDGDNKNCDLVRGTLKSYNADKKEMVMTDDKGKDWTFDRVDAKVRLNRQEGKMRDIKIGEPVLALVERNGEKFTLKQVMAERK